jgi:hypothetical protein
VNLEFPLTLRCCADTYDQEHGYAHLWYIARDDEPSVKTWSYLLGVDEVFVVLGPSAYFTNDSVDVFTCLFRGQLCYANDSTLNHTGIKVVDTNISPYTGRKIEL